MIIKAKSTDKVIPMFGEAENTILLSCLQNIMGEIYCDSEDDPVSAMASLGDFCFFAGKANAELVAFTPESHKSDLMVMVPGSDDWSDIIESFYKDRAKKIDRYATKRAPELFDKNKLCHAVNLLSFEYTLSQIDEAGYRLCLSESWSADLVSQYDTYESYAKNGLGYIITSGDKLICGASSFSSYHGGIEIQITTNEPYRRKGFAYIASSKLILECLNRGLYPSWDAHNTESLELAKKLGYVFSHSYKAYEVTGY